MMRPLLMLLSLLALAAPAYAKGSAHEKTRPEPVIAAQFLDDALAAQFLPFAALSPTASSVPSSTASSTASSNAPASSTPAASSSKPVSSATSTATSTATTSAASTSSATPVTSASAPTAPPAGPSAAAANIYASGRLPRDVTRLLLGAAIALGVAGFALTESRNLRSMLTRVWG